MLCSGQGLEEVGRGAVRSGGRCVRSIRPLLISVVVPSLTIPQQKNAC